MANTIDLGAVSAYAIAKENGYTGTEAQWIEELSNTTQNATEAREAAEFVQNRTFGVVIENNGIRFDARQTVTDSLAERAETAATTASESATSAETYATRAETALAGVESAIENTASADIVAEEFSTSKTYPLGSYVIYDKKLYVCTTAITTAGAWNASKWTETKLTKFESLPVDTGLNTTGKPADAKATGDAINDLRTDTEEAIDDANAWKTQGSNGQIMSKKNGVPTWVDAPPIDTTLSILGQSADAKAVGDAFNNTNAWKNQGTENQILSRNSQGIVWIDNPPVDDTLSVPNQPADAKAVGDALASSNAWKSQGTTNQILSKSENGVAWVDNPPVDATLTEQGQPADAKEVGDRLASHDARITTAANNAANALSNTGVISVTLESQSEDISEIQSNVDNVNTLLSGFINNVVISDDETEYVFMHDEDILFTLPRGGGGGGGSVEDVKMTSRITTGWLSKNTYQDDVPFSFTWSSLENEIETGPGRYEITCNGFSEIIGIDQGDVEGIISKEWLRIGKNEVKLVIYDSLNHIRRHTLTINVSDIRIESLLDNSQPLYGDLSVVYTVYGKMNKTIHILIDGTEIATTSTTATGVNLQQVIPQQEAGVHSLEMYMTATIGSDTITSNRLFYELMWLDEYSDRPLITVDTRGGEITQYDTINVPYRVYTPNQATTDVDIYVNNVLIQHLEDVDRNPQVFSYIMDHFNDPSNPEDVTTVKFIAPNILTPKIITYVVKPSEVTIEAETTGLRLYLDSKNRSNNEAAWDDWSYGEIHAQFSNFNRKFDGWQIDNEGYSVLRVENDARVYIPFTFFDRSFSSSGATFEIEFSTRQVIDYNTDLVTCLDNGKGFRFTPTLVQFNTGTQIWARYSDNEHVRVSYVFDKSDYNENERLIKIYINGVWSKTEWYSGVEISTQTNPTGISIGSNDAGIDIYCIRAYNTTLSDKQIVLNYLADMRDKTKMITLYQKNDIYNEINQITPESLRSKIPVFIIKSSEWPANKETRIDAQIEYYNDMNPAFSFTTVLPATIAGQGTSSSAYYRKNISVKFQKNSILMNDTSTPISKYSLTSDSIADKSFVLKKDVASSEGANNVQGCMIYNEFCPYKTPEMRENPQYRWGIEGYPAVMFWQNTNDNSIEFIGKCNFNLAKRCPGPLGYPDDDEQLANEDVASRLESWEIQHNNNENVKFQSSNFEGEGWKDDFEARIPDEYYVFDKIKELSEFISSCNMHKATNQILSSPVTYQVNVNYTFKDFTEEEGKYSYTVNNGIYSITFTHDTACYRLTKFRALAPEYMQMESFCWYYIWAFIFLAADSYAKNMFIGFRGDPVTVGGPVQHYKRKAVAEVYDADTILGIDNLGNLCLSPFLIDTDYVIQNNEAGEYPRTDDSTQEKVFDAQDSVIFENIRIAFWDLCRTTLANAINAGFTAEGVIARFRAHRNKWSASIYNADANSTYIITHIKKLVVNKTTGDLDYDHTYLPKLLGDKDSQMAWFTRKRWRYVSSMYTVGDANNIFISFRVSRKGTITLWPVHDLYCGLRFGEGGTNQVQRVFEGGSASFTLDSGSAEISRFECRIFSGDLIKKIDGLAAMKAAFINFSMAYSLEEIVLGDPEEGNTYLNDFYADNCPLLKKVDLRNCPNITKDIELEKSKILEEGYFEGTTITGINLAEGCLINTLHLPGTILRLILVDMPNLTDLQIASYDNIEIFMFKDVNPAINGLDILNQLTPGIAINVDIDETVTDSEELFAFYDMLDTMHGVYRLKNSSGNWEYYTDEDNPDIPGTKRQLSAQVSGTIHVGFLDADSLDLLEEKMAKYPYLKVDIVSSVSKRYYMNYDGTEIIKIVSCVDGVPQDSAPNVPARASTAQNDFTPNGWSKLMNSTVGEANLSERIKTNHYFYAAYSQTVRSYSITWQNEDNTTLATETYEYGQTPSYKGSTPTYEGQSSTGWYPAITAVTGPQTYRAVYKPMYTVSFVTSARDGNNTLQSGRIIEGQTATYNGTTPTTIRGTTEDFTFAGWVPSFGPIYADTMYTAVFRDNRSEVIKYLEGYLTGFESANVNDVKEYAFYENENLEVVNLASTDPVVIEANAFSGCTNMEHLIIRSNTMATLQNINAFTNTKISQGKGAIYVPSSLVETYKADNNWKNYYVFSIDEYPVSGLDGSSLYNQTWEQIINNNNYATDYVIGDTKGIDLGTHGSVLMELVAIDADDKADGSGKARMTWICKDLLNTTHNMNSSGTNADGWPATAMRTWLRSTILPLFPEVIRNNIVEVNKTYYDYTTKSTLTSTDTIWIPSAREVFGGTSYEDSGVIYSGRFTSNSNRIKKRNGSADRWWLRSAYSSYSSNFYCVSYNGNSGNVSASYTLGVVPGFCI